VQTILPVERQRNRSEKLGEFAGGAAPAQVHLEEAVLPVNESGRIGKVSAIAGSDRRDAGCIAFDPYVVMNMLDMHATVELRQAATQCEIAGKCQSQQQNYRTDKQPFQESHDVKPTSRRMS
jgi:hypothetical protein